MNWHYGKVSSLNRDSCHPVLRGILDRGLEVSPVDIAVVWGWRGEKDQTTMVRLGVSKTPWPGSKHNHMEDGEPHSLAFDFAPVIKGKIDWEDTHMFAVVAGVFMGVAAQTGVRLRWGGDWNLNGLTTDQSFMDWGHLELHEEDSE